MCKQDEEWIRDRLYKAETGIENIMVVLHQYYAEERKTDIPKYLIDAVCEIQAQIWDTSADWYGRKRPERVGFTFYGERRWKPCPHYKGFCQRDEEDCPEEE